MKRIIIDNYNEDTINLEEIDDRSTIFAKDNDNNIIGMVVMVKKGKKEYFALITNSFTSTKEIEEDDDELFEELKALISYYQEDYGYTFFIED